jgi:hypothetical protein
VEAFKDFSDAVKSVPGSVNPTALIETRFLTSQRTRSADRRVQSGTTHKDDLIAAHATGVLVVILSAFASISELPNQNATQPKENRGSLRHPSAHVAKAEGSL